MGRHESVCPTCGRSFQAIGRHWSTGDCDYPPIDADQQELLAGLLAGDGFINRPRDRDDGKGETFPKFELELTDHEYVEWVGERLEPFTSNVTTREHDDNRRETARLYTVGHPDLQQAAFTCEMDRPATLAFGFDITPAILNILFCTRGSLAWVDGGATVRLHPSGRFAHLLERFLRRQGWTYNVVRDGDFYLRRSDTEAFFEYIGDAPPGFAWKWQHDDEEAYRERAPTRSKNEPHPPEPAPEPEPIQAGHDDVVNVSEGYREGKKVHILRERPDGYYERICGRYDDGSAFDPRARQVTADGFLRLSNHCLLCERSADLPDSPKPQELDFDPVEAGLLGGADAVEGDTEANPTVNLEPDWEWLGDELDRLGFPQWAEDARAKRLTKREVYGPVLRLLYRFRHASPEDIARL